MSKQINSSANDGWAAFTQKASNEVFSFTIVVSFRLAYCNTLLCDKHAFLYGIPLRNLRLKIDENVRRY